MVILKTSLAHARFEEVLLKETCYSQLEEQKGESESICKQGLRGCRLECNKKIVKNVDPSEEIEM